MIVEMLNRSEKDLDKFDYRDALLVTVDGSKMLDVHDGEDEDNSLGRNFSDCYNVVNMMKLAHRAGVKGETLQIIEANFDGE